MAAVLAELPAPRSSYLPPQARSFSAPSNQYGAPSQAQPRNSYQAPAARPRTNYGPPQQQPRQNYGPPAQQQPSSNYGPPSTSYGVPQAQDFNNFDNQRANSYQQAPSNTYGVPSQQDSYSNNGNNQGGYEEPAKYDFQYDVQDDQAGLDFGHKESRDGSVATGKYYVLLPDGRKQVKYQTFPLEELLSHYQLIFSFLPLRL